MVANNPFIVDAHTAVAIVQTPHNQLLVEQPLVVGVPCTSSNLVAFISSSQTAHHCQIKIDLQRGYFVYPDLRHVRRFVEKSSTALGLPSAYTLTKEGREHLQQNPSGVIFVKDTVNNFDLIWLLNPKETITEIKDLTPQIKTSPNALKV